MQQHKALEVEVVRQLGARGLSRAPGELAFVHQGTVVQVSVNESVYRGLFVTVHGVSAKRQFRLRNAAYDWDGIAAAIRSTADEHRLAHVTATHRLANSVIDSAIAFLPAKASSGRVRVKLPELDLDPASAMQLYALLQQTLPARRSRESDTPASQLSI